MYTFYLFRIFLGESKAKWMEWLGFSLLFIINSATFLLASNPYLNLVSTILPLIAISFLYTTTIFTKILVSVMVVTVSMILDSVSFNIGSIFLFDNMNENQLFTNVTGSFLFFLLAQVIKKIRTPQKNTTLFCHIGL